MANHTNGQRLTKKKGSVLTVGEILNLALIESKAFKTFWTNFLLVYNIRAGVSFLIRFLGLLIRDTKAAFSLSKLLDENELKFREEAVRTGLLVGGFTGIYKAAMSLFAWYDKPEKGEVKKNKNWHSAVAGFLAGFSLLIMDKSWHRTLALYMATRAVQCWYNFNKAQGYFHFWGSNWNHGDSLLFILSSAQIMYAYVMRPETLPTSYYKFIVKQGPIDEVILKAVRDSCRSNPVDTKAVIEYVQQKGGNEAMAAVRPYLEKASVDMIPCRALHPYTKSCGYHTFLAFVRVAKQIFGVYLSLALVPAVVLRFKHFVKSPLPIVLKSVLSAAQSASFLASYCSGYQAFICAQREVFQYFNWRDSKFVYWWAAMFSGLSILLEKKNRRSELALYALPRAADSVFLILNDRKLAYALPYGELLLFCTSMGAVMWFFENHRDTVSPLVVKLMERFLANDNIIKLDNDAVENGSASGRFSTSSDDEDKFRPQLSNPALGTIMQHGSAMSLSGSLITP